MTPLMISTKTYTHSVGLSTVFRQWKAKSHCSFLHGYSLQVEVKFVGDLDDRNWVIDFGSLKPFKQWLQDTFDHKTVIDIKDPQLDEFQYLDTNKIIQLVVLPDGVGCEKFSQLIYEQAEAMLEVHKQADRVDVYSVEVSEHEGNSAIALNPKFHGVRDVG